MNQTMVRAEKGRVARGAVLLSVCLGAMIAAGCGGGETGSSSGGSGGKTGTTTSGQGASGGAGGGTTSMTSGGSAGSGGVGGMAGGGGTSTGGTGTGGLAGTGGMSTGGMSTGGVSSGGVAGSGGSGGSTGQGGSGGGVCAPLSGSGCAPCLSNACCAEFDACYASDNCKRCLIGDPAATDCGADAAYVSFGACAAGSCQADCLSCAGHFTGACDYCMQDACCAEVSACAADPACMDCLTATPGDPACAGNTAAQAALACSNTHCSDSCMKAPSGAGCDAPGVAPSGGSCVTLAGDVACNPVTNEGCDATLGEVCDADINGFSCRPPPNEKGLCQDCDHGVPCAAGMTCAGAGICVKYCCNDADCGTGTCDVLAVPTGGGAVGLCRGGGAPAAVPPTNHCDWLEGDKCEGCCAKAYPGGDTVYGQALSACACSACAGPCASVCPGDITAAPLACRECIADAFTAGSCDPAACQGNPACAGFLQCATACED